MQRMWEISNSWSISWWTRKGRACVCVECSRSWFDYFGTIIFSGEDAENVWNIKIESIHMRKKTMAARRLLKGNVAVNVKIAHKLEPMEMVMKWFHQWWGCLFLHWSNSYKGSEITRLQKLWLNETILEFALRKHQVVDHRAQDGELLKIYLRMSETSREHWMKVRLNVRGKQLVGVNTKGRSMCWLCQMGS